VVVDNLTGLKTRLSGAAELAPDIIACPIRYVMSDELVCLCADLAYSSGTRVLDCVDLIRIPAARLWLEWREEPWHSRLREWAMGGVTRDLVNGVGAIPMLFSH